MPVLPDLEDFPYEAQDAHTLTCVPDCVSMVYQHLGLVSDWALVAGELGFSELDGTPFDNIQDLSEVVPTFVEDLAEAEIHLGLSRPIIVNVRVRGPELLTYARSSFLHAVILVGCTEGEVVLIDPLALSMLGSAAPIRRPRRALERAWQGGYVLLGW
ncbi:MAG: hypothetical protein K0Q72_2250 [Armatimonadetes bacterium]|jgi:hypothetical protein|nr:hypothetical protein [Armatimonadota bacterium]